MIPEHRRRWSRQGVSFDPVHYLALLERKPVALDHARPLDDWELPECFAVLRRRLEAAYRWLRADSAYPASKSEGSR